MTLKPKRRAAGYYEVGRCTTILRNASGRWAVFHGDRTTPRAVRDTLRDATAAAVAFEAANDLSKE